MGKSKWLMVNEKWMVKWIEKIMKGNLVFCEN